MRSSLGSKFQQLVVRFRRPTEDSWANSESLYPRTTTRNRPRILRPRLRPTTARALVRHHVLRLTYTAHDMAPFARDLGYDGPPFIWNDEQRRHLRARLDALYFHLYGLSRADAAYILDTFPIVRRHDEAAFGHYRTKAMVLAYYNALAAGDTDTDVAL